MHYNNEQKLWQNVVLRAVMDAFAAKHYTNKYHNHNISDAQNWLLHNRTSYFEVCSMANIDPISLREKVKAVLSPLQNEKDTSFSVSNNYHEVSGALNNHDDFSINE